MQQARQATQHTESIHTRLTSVTHIPWQHWFHQPQRQKRMANRTAWQTWSFSLSPIHRSIFGLVFTQRVRHQKDWRRGWKSTGLHTPYNRRQFYSQLGYTEYFRNTGVALHTNHLDADRLLYVLHQIPLSCRGRGGREDRRRGVCFDIYPTIPPSSFSTY